MGNAKIAVPSTSLSVSPASLAGRARSAVPNEDDMGVISPPPVEEPLALLAERTVAKIGQPISPTNAAPRMISANRVFKVEDRLPS